MKKLATAIIAITTSSALLASCTGKESVQEGKSVSEGMEISELFGSGTGTSSNVAKPATVESVIPGMDSVQRAKNMALSGGIIE